MLHAIASSVSSGLDRRVSLSKFMRHVMAGCLCVMLLSSCGFKLRGAYQLPAAMTVTYVEAASADPGLARALIRGLKASKIKIATLASDDIAVLTLSRETKTKRTVSVDARGWAREVTLSYAVNFHVKADSSGFEISSQDIIIERDFVFDTEDVLGNSREESQLYEEIQQDLVRLILLRLQSYTQTRS